MLIPLRDNLFRLDTPFLGLPLSLYVITGDRTILIDSGINSTPSEFIFPALDAANLTPDLLICTHGHIDHFGGNAALRVRYPAMKIAIHEQDAAWAEDHKRHFYEMYMCMPHTWQENDPEGFLELCGGNSAIDVHLIDDQELELGAFRFRTIQTGGHCPGHISLFDPKEGVAICGDVALGWGALAPGAPKINPYYYDVDQYVNGLEAIGLLEADLFCTGHSGALDRAEMAELIAHSKNFVETLANWTMDAVNTKAPQGLGSIARQVLNQLDGYEIGFHLHASVQAHLTKFCREGSIASVMVDGQKAYIGGA